MKAFLHRLARMFGFGSERNADRHDRGAQDYTVPTERLTDEQLEQAREANERG